MISQKWPKSMKHAADQWGTLRACIILTDAKQYIMGSDKAFRKSYQASFIASKT